MHRLFADVPLRFPKPREKQFLATVIAAQIDQLAGEGRRPGRLSLALERDSW